MAGEEQREGPSRAQLVRLVIVLVVILLVLWFAFANSQRVKVDFIVAERRARLIYVILASAVLGAIAGSLLRWRRGRDRD